MNDQSPAEETLSVDFLHCVKIVNDRTMDRIRTRIGVLQEPAREAVLGVFEKFPSLTQATSFAQKLSLGLAYDLGITDIESLVRINKASIYGSCYAFLVDRIVDDNGQVDWASPRAVYIAHLLFMFYLESLAEICPSAWSPRGLQNLVQAEMESNCAMFEEEHAHVGVATTYETKRVVAHKCSSCKALAREILQLAGRPELESSVFKIIEDSTFAYCILDDLFDWEEDLDRGRFMYPIQRCIDQLDSSYKELEAGELKAAVLKRLAFGTVYHELMQEATTLLKDLAERVTPISRNLALCYRLSLGLAMEGWKDHVAFLCGLSNA